MSINTYFNSQSVEFSIENVANKLQNIEKQLNYYAPSHGYLEGRKITFQNKDVDVIAKLESFRFIITMCAGDLYAIECFESIHAQKLNLLKDDIKRLNQLTNKWIKIYQDIPKL